MRGLNLIQRETVVLAKRGLNNEHTQQRGRGNGGVAHLFSHVVNWATRRRRQGTHDRPRWHGQRMDRIYQYIIMKRKEDKNTGDNDLIPDSSMVGLES